MCRVLVLPAAVWQALVKKGENAFDAFKCVVEKRVEQHRMNFRVIASVAVALCCGTPLSALAGEPTRPRIEIPFAERTPALRAELDDAAWTAAATIPSLSPSIESQPTPTAQRASVQLLWDQHFLYVRFVCEDDDIFATLSGRDAEYHHEDVVEVFLDPVGDGKEFIELQVSPNNGVRDAIHLCTGEPKYDEKGMFTPELIARDDWEFVCWNLDGLRTAASRFAQGKTVGWLAEMAIPANCLRRTGEKEFKPMNLHANFIRLDYPKSPLKPEERVLVSSNWSSIVKGRPHRSPGANGTLVLLPDHQPRVR